MKEDFEKSIHQDIESGTLKFSRNFVSTFQLFTAAKKWVETDDRVLSAAIRPGGSNQNALDFRYNTEGLQDSKKKGSSLHEIFKPFFEQELGDDYLIGWDFGSETVIIK